ncbi:urease accessory protein UreF [Parvibaculum sp.]|uniref:urease accessory protein UreF n=1 Tax=Parvibaculum sp. TaxID=2024848 RepID=UPI002B6987BA|nr:urease accessory protein UreF [Parvibaculum sp.]HUD50534.1 urease accessory protein UreF [Parvibaculum sp.]
MTTMIIIITAMRMDTVMVMDSAALYRLMTWMSPSYPVGSFSYSHGLEWEVEEGTVNDAGSLTRWLCDIVLIGSGRNDAIFLAHAHGVASRGDDETLGRLADYALAFAGSAERRMETEQQGRAFCEVTCRTWGSPTLDRLRADRSPVIAYPIAVGVAAVDHGMALMPVLEAYVHAFAANLISAGVRLVPLGHSDGQRVTIAIEPAVREAAMDAATGDLSRLASVTIMADIASMKHETQYTRLFRS